MRTKIKREAVQVSGGVENPAQARVAQLVAVEEGGIAWLDFGDGEPPARATVIFTATREQLEHVMDIRAPVVAYGGDDTGWQLVAVVGVALSAPTSPSAPSHTPCLQADVDGQRVQVTAQKEIVLSCGKASITLRANGRVIIKGTQIESYSEGTNRIKGGQVRIN